MQLTRLQLIFLIYVDLEKNQNVLQSTLSRQK
jgi:hypothetical protein